MKPEFKLRPEQPFTVGTEHLVDDELLTATSVIFPGNDRESPIHGEVFPTPLGISVNGREFLPTCADMFRLTKFSDPGAEEIVAIELETHAGIVTFFLNNYIPGKGWEYSE